MAFCIPMFFKFLPITFFAHRAFAGHIHFYTRLKSALTEVSAPKTQTPLVAKPTLRNKESLTSTETEFVFLTNSHYGREKGIVSLQ